MTDSGKSGGWLKRLLGGVGPKPAHPELTEHFSWLDHVEKGLTAKVVNFVLTGENATVIASLDALRNQTAKVRSTTIHSNKRGYQKLDIPADFIIDPANDIGRKERFVRVIALTNFANMNFHRISTDAVCKNVQSLLNVLSHYSNARKNISARFPLDALVELICKLGGRPADLLDHLALNTYSALPDRFGGRNAVLGYALNLEPAEVIEGISRQPNSEKVKAITAMTAQKIASKPVYIDFLLDLLTSGAATLRDVARAALLTQDHTTVAQKVIPLASAGKIGVRTAAIQLLGEIGTEPAMAVLRDRREVEKSQSLQMLLDQFIGSESSVKSAEIDGGYQAADGSVVTLPARITLSQGTDHPFTKDDLATLQEIDAREEKQALERYAARKAAGYKPGNVPKIKTGKDLFALFTGEKRQRTHNDNYQGDQSNLVNLVYISNSYHAWVTQALDRMPTGNALQLALSSVPNLMFLTSHWYRNDPYTQWMIEALRLGKFDLRDLTEYAEKARLHAGTNVYNNRSEAVEQGAFTHRWMVSVTRSGTGTATNLKESYEQPTYWPLIAENLDVISDALPPTTLTAQENIGALAMLELLPALPAQLVSQVLFVAIGESRTARNRARALLADVADLDDTIAATLTDKRQSVRASAASFLAQRDSKSALPHLVKRLKTEKSETARAAMISAVADLGGDTSPYLSQKALVAEAEKLAAKLPAGKIDWLPLDQAPALHWKDGKKVEDRKSVV